MSTAKDQSAGKAEGAGDRLQPEDAVRACSIAELYYQTVDY